MRNIKSNWIKITFATVIIGLVLVGCTGVPAQPVNAPVSQSTKPQLLTLTGTSLPNKVNPTLPVSTLSMSLIPTQKLVDATSGKSSTPASTPTITARTQRPTRTPNPTRTPRPTRTATNTPTPLPPPVHDAPIRIFSPSSFSKVTSPFTLSAAVLPGSRGVVHMQLIGEDGTVLQEKTWSNTSTVGWRMNINEKITFTPRVVAESARLVLYTYDEDKRLMALASEEFILMQLGKPVLSEPDNLKDPFALFKPYPDQNIKNGLLVVDGAVRCRVDCRLLFELVDRSGKMIARFEDPEVIQASLDYTRVEKSYKVEINSPTTVRLIMHQQDIYTTEDLAVSSMIIRLLP